MQSITGWLEIQCDLQRAGWVTVCLQPSVHISQGQLGGPTIQILEMLRACPYTVKTQGGWQGTLN